MQGLSRKDARCRPRDPLRCMSCANAERDAGPQMKGGAGVRDASERLEVHCRDIHEERAAKRVKHGEITVQASSKRRSAFLHPCRPCRRRNQGDGHRGASEGEA